MKREKESTKVENHYGNTTIKREGGETVWKKFITLLMILLVMLLTNVMVFADPSEERLIPKIV